MDYEVLATSALKTVISKTDLLEAYVSEKDREPHWDGSIHVYRKLPKLETNSEGRVHLQVKGKKASNLNCESITYPVRISDLRQYLNEGGAMYIVGAISLTGECRLYYRSLLPYDLKSILNKLNRSTGTKSIWLKPLPSDKIELTNLFFNYLSDHEKQLAIVTAQKIYTLHDLTEQYPPSDLKLSFHYTNISPKNKWTPTPGAVIPNSGYLYATLPSGDVTPIALSKEVVVSEKSATINESVSSGGITYYNSYKIVTTETRVEVHIDKSCVFLLTDNHSEFTYTLSGTISERIQSLSFLLSICSSKNFSLGKHDFDLSCITENTFDFEWLSNSLELLTDIQASLQSLHISLDLDIDAISADDWTKLTKLVPAILHKTPVPLSFGDSTSSKSIAYLHIHPLYILLSVNKTDRPNYYIQSDFFGIKCVYSSKGCPETKYPSSPYILLDPNALNSVSNLSFECLAASVCDTPHSELYWNQVNQLLLSLLTAYDTSGNSSQLDAAAQLSDWLIAHNTDSRSDIICRLNHYQIIRRRRDFLPSEVEELLALLEGGSLSEANLTGVYILLGNEAAAHIHLSRMSKKEQSSFINYPIYALLLKRT